MLINLRVFDDDGGRLLKEYEYDNEIELVEKSIELFNETGGEVGYKVPEPGEKFISGIIGKILKSGDIHKPTVPRLTFTPPKPEPVESEWEILREAINTTTFLLPDTIQNALETIMDKIDDLDRRCPAGGGK